MSGHNRKSSIALLVAASIVAAGCSKMGPPNGLDPATPAAAPVFTPSDYVIGASDSLSVFVYRSPDLSMSVGVRPDGKISIPLVEDIQAAGKTPTQLAREIEERLKKYVQDPTVTVIVSGFVGQFDRQIRVIGEATDPHMIPYRDHMSLLDVMIDTKGVTKFAAGNRAVIIRHYGSPEQKTINVRLDDLVKNGDISQNVEMQPGDTLIIPQTWF